MGLSNDHLIGWLIRLASVKTTLCITLETTTEKKRKWNNGDICISKNEKKSVQVSMKISFFLFLHDNDEFNALSNHFLMFLKRNNTLLNSPLRKSSWQITSRRFHHSDYPWPMQKLDQQVTKKNTHLFPCCSEWVRSFVFKGQICHVPFFSCHYLLKIENLL